MARFDGKVALVTGGTRGIGRAVAERFAAEGARVVVAGRSEPDPPFARNGDAAAPVYKRTDVASAADVRALVTFTVDRFGSLDVLVNNAGYGYMSALEEGEDEEVRTMFDTNFFGAVDLIKAVLPGMRERGRGHVINVSSMTGLVANPPNVYYSASKFALEAVTEGLSKEVGPFGIRVSAVEPGAIRTDWSVRSMKESSTPIEAYAETVGARKELIKLAGSKFPGDPRKVAEAIVKLTDLEDPPLRLVLGHDVFKGYGDKLRASLDSLEEWKSTSLGVNFDPT